MLIDMDVGNTLIEGSFPVNEAVPLFRVRSPAFCFSEVNQAEISAQRAVAISLIDMSQILTCTVYQACLHAARYL